MKKITLLSLSLLVCFAAMAQTPPIEMATGFYADGKIYVVITVGLLILSGIFAYLFLLDRKISRLEAKMNTKTFSK